MDNALHLLVMMVLYKYGKQVDMCEFLQIVANERSGTAKSLINHRTHILVGSQAKGHQFLIKILVA